MWGHAMTLRVIVACLGASLLACGEPPPESPGEEAQGSTQGELVHAHSAEPSLGPLAPLDIIPDMLPDMGPGEPVSVCGEEPESSECGDCAPGFRCESAFCGGEVCVPGNPCRDDADCPTGGCIRPEGAPPSERGMCTSLSTCAETRECALGFHCESGSCVDRRIPCGFHSVGCPRGSICSFMPVEGRSFCVAAQTPCDHDGYCEPGAHCVDVDGDGEQECAPAGRCSSNTECPPGFSCGVDPGTSQSSCVVDGACRDGDCPGGLTCLDTGSGRSRCVRSGDCVHDSECPPQSVCGSVHPTDPLRCLSFDGPDEGDAP